MIYQKGKCSLYLYFQYEYKTRNGGPLILMYVRSSLMRCQKSYHRDYPRKTVKLQKNANQHSSAELLVNWDLLSNISYFSRALLISSPKRGKMSNLQSFLYHSG